MNECRESLVAMRKDLAGISMFKISKGHGGGKTSWEGVGRARLHWHWRVGRASRIRRIGAHRTWGAEDVEDILWVPWNWDPAADQQPADIRECCHVMLSGTSHQGHSERGRARVEEALRITEQGQRRILRQAEREDEKLARNHEQSPVEGRSGERPSL